MKLEKIIIKGFRSYRERTEIDISALTALIGANDVGKSTILDALDAFFNDVVDVQDINTRISEKEFSVGCVFSNLPEKINLDSRSETTLQEEYLLNDSGKLEIYKVWRTTAAKAEVERIYAWAKAPAHERAENLLFKKRDDLKEIVETNALEADKRKNPDMRRAIYLHLEERGKLNLQLREVVLDRPKDASDAMQDARKIWKKLKDRHLPVYSLFKSEQVQGDKEKVVRSPLDTTLKLAVKELNDQLSKIAEAVQKQVEETTSRTLERLKRDYPEVAKNLAPEYKEPSWSKAFDLDVLRGDDDVPLNKRGTGVRRLVVLAFFQAEAERERQERSSPVIYGVEEPETSQHPNFQRKIIESFKALAEAGDQVILTTHVPGLAELLPIDSIRFISRPLDSPMPRIRNGADGRKVLLEVAESLGMLPDSASSKNAQIVAWVEGKSDVWVLESIANKLEEAGVDLSPLDIKKIVYVPGGGDSLLKFVVNGEYLNRLGLPQFYLLDSDKKSREHPGKEIPHDVERRVREQGQDGEGLPICVLRTRKREIENYLHPETVKRVFGQSVDIKQLLPGFDFDFGKMSTKDSGFWKKLCDVRRDARVRPPSRSSRGSSLDSNEPKHVICGWLLQEATLEELRERCRSTDPEGAERSEVEEWFHKMADLVRTHRGR